MLNNPLWSSLTGRHARFASGDDALKVYPWEMVPFAAVPEPNTRLTDERLSGALGERPFVYFVGALPLVESERYEETALPDIVQMVCAQLHPSTRDVPFRELTHDDVPAMIDLTSRVYPAYFRERTIEMGPYLGIHEGDELVAMAGLRMAPQGYRELSGVCTDPRVAGRGYAGLLCTRLAERVIAAGEIPMLHFDANNVRARRLYEALGFEVRSTAISMCRVSRRGEQAHTEV